MCFASKSRTLFLSRYVREVFFTAEKAKKQFGLGQQKSCTGEQFGSRSIFKLEASHSYFKQSTYMGKLTFGVSKVLVKEGESLS